MLIRKLKYQDCLTLAKLIKVLIDKIGSGQLLNLISADKKSKETESNVAGENSTEEKDSKEQTYVKIGVNLLNQLILYVEEDLNKWFADLCSCTVPELLEKDFDTPIIIIDELIKAEESNRFFTRALQVYKTTVEFPEALKNLLTK